MCLTFKQSKYDDDLAEWRNSEGTAVCRYRGSDEIYISVHDSDMMPLSLREIEYVLDNLAALLRFNVFQVPVKLRGLIVETLPVEETKELVAAIESARDAGADLSLEKPYEEEYIS